MRRDALISRDIWSLAPVILACLLLHLTGCAAMFPSYSSASTTPANAKIGGNYSTRSVGGRTIDITIEMPD
jgi:hypothetical protein